MEIWNLPSAIPFHNHLNTPLTKERAHQTVMIFSSGNVQESNQGTGKSHREDMHLSQRNEAEARSALCVLACLSHLGGEQAP